MDTRRRRTIRRIGIGLSAFALTLASYVGMWLAVSLMFQDESPVPSANIPVLVKAELLCILPLFAPLVEYCESDLPGGKALGRLWWRINTSGTYFDNETDLKIDGWKIGPEFQVIFSPPELELMAGQSQARATQPAAGR